MATKKKDNDKKQTEANNIRQELADDADERKTYIRMALNDLPDADKVSGQESAGKDAGDHQGHVPGRVEFEERDHHRKCD